MPARPRSTAGAKSARQKWEEAASHRYSPDDAQPDRTVGDAAQREAFLNTRDGVFYPSGHAVMLLAPDDAHALRSALVDAGFPLAESLLLAPREAASLMRDSEEQAGALSRIVGGEIRNVQVMRQLADSGSALLIVRVDDEKREQALVATARRWSVAKALRYHALAIEELPIGVEAVPGESPYGVNEVLRSKPSDAQVTPGNARRGKRSR